MPQDYSTAPPPVLQTPGRPFLYQFPSPDLSDRLLSILTDSRRSEFVMPEKGDPYAGVDPEPYADFKFATAKPVEQSPGWWLLFYVNDRSNQDDYNYKIDYPYVDTAFPRYTRSYILTRADFTEPNEGSADPVVTGLTLTGHKQSRSEDPVVDSLFVAVERTYEVIPGPFIVKTKVDEDGMILTTSTRKNIATAIASGEDITTGVWTRVSKGEGDSYIADEIHEARPVPGSSMPTNKLDPDGEVVFINKRIKAIADITTVEDLTTGVWSETILEDYPGSNLVAYEIQQHREVPGGYMISTEIDPDGIVVTSSKRLRAQGDIVTSESILGGVWTKVYQTDPPIFRGFLLRSGNLVCWEITETRALPGNPLLTQSIGQENLTPAKYRRLIRKNDTNTLVDPDYDFPSGLTGDQVEVSLAQETIAKARLKIMSEIIAVGADPLLGGETNEYGALSIYETVVNEGTPIDEGFLILKSTVTPFGNGKAVKITVQYPADLAAREQPGQTYDDTFDLTIPYVNRVAPLGTEIGDNRKDITPIDYERARVKTIDPSTVAAVFGSYLLSFPSTTTIEIPDVLTSLTIISEPSHGDGTATEDIDLYDWHGDHSLTTPLKATAQGSAAMTAEVVPGLIPFYGSRRQVTNYMFLLPAPVGSTDVADRLEAITGLTVTDWTVFNPRYTTVVMISKRESVQASAGITVHDSNNSGGSATIRTTNRSQSSEVGITVKTVRIPPTIHGAISVSSPPTDITAMVTASVSGTPAFAVLAPTMPSVSVTATGSLSITAIGVGATPGATALPSSGLLIVKTDCRPYKYGWVMVNAEVIDASTL